MSRVPRQRGRREQVGRRVAEVAGAVLSGGEHRRAVDRVPHHLDAGRVGRDCEPVQRIHRILRIHPGLAVAGEAVGRQDGADHDRLGELT
jgi:hypothetical protein